MKKISVWLCLCIFLMSLCAPAFAQSSVSITSAVIEEHIDPALYTVKVSFSAPVTMEQITVLLSSENVNSVSEAVDEKIIWLDQTDKPNNGIYEFVIEKKRVETVFGTTETGGKPLYLKIGGTNTTEADTKILVYPGGPQVDDCEHSYVPTIYPPQKGKDGYTHHVCSKCGDNYKDTYVDALGYDVKYDANGGSFSGSNQNKRPGKALTLSTIVPVKSGYVFKGWSTDKNASTAQYQAGASYTTDSDITLYAIWSLPSYNLVYKIDGVVYKTVSLTSGSTITPEKDPVKTGYTFSGWSSIPATMPAGHLEITGTFIINKYKLTYRVDGEVYKTFDVTYGSTIESVTKPEKSGYTFVEWKSLPTKMPANDVVVNAVWKKNNSDIGGNSGGGGGGFGGGGGGGIGGGGSMPIKPSQPQQSDKPVQEQPVVSALGFSDVKDSDWFYPGVSFVKEEKLMGGVSDTEFAPNGKLTRAMLVTILYRLEGSPECAAPTFTDVPAGEWYSAGVAWAADQGVVNGVGDNLFAPNQNITREQIAVILYNYSVLKEKEVTKTAELSGFSDSNTVSAWAENALKWAVGSELIGGKGNNDLDPKGSATRAELATILMRYLAK